MASKEPLRAIGLWDRANILWVALVGRGGFPCVKPAWWIEKRRLPRISLPSKNGNERKPNIRLPMTPWALGQRRSIMENQESKDGSPTATAEPDFDSECMTDCCACCCCDTEEECSMEA
jgi:hypothetical protein